MAISPLGNTLNKITPKASSALLQAYFLGLVRIVFETRHSAEYYFSNDKCRLSLG